MAGTLVSFLLTYALCVHLHAGAAPAILATVLCLGMTRAPQRHGIREMLRRFVTLPLVALGASAIGATVVRFPVAGEAIFALGMSLSVELREYGRAASALGRTIALTLIAMLVVPVAIDSSAGIGVTIALVVLAAIVAELCARGAALLARDSGVAAIEEAALARPLARDGAKRASALSATRRMALQMLVALSAAFAIGMPFFHQHWPWVVLSAFIVTSGAIGRGDALYKAFTRVAGAIAGTMVAALLAFVHFGSSVEYAAVVFLVLFVGIWLRRINYAWWAACATLLFALLQGLQSSPGVALFATRVLCIAIGAACGVLATWFVVPIRSRSIVRRRLADAMADMRDALHGESRDLDRHHARLERIAPAWRLHRSVFARTAPDAHPASWIERALRLLAQMRAVDFDRRNTGRELRSLRGDAFGDRDDRG